MEAAPSATVRALPLADGGEGTLDRILEARAGTRVAIEVRGPLGDPVTAEYGVLEDGTAVLESALFCVLSLIEPARRDPMRSSSYGLGEGIASALDAGCATIILGLGGSATVDGGVGMARALGYRFEEASGTGPAGVSRIEPSVIHPKLREARFKALCDVEHVLLGPAGAARVFGPQKGAGPVEVERLEAGLKELLAAVVLWKGPAAAGLADHRGAGAAGGLGLGASAFLDAALLPGADAVMEILGFARLLSSCDLVVTGEGSLDDQTAAGGKVVARVLREAGRKRVSCVIVAGRWDGTLPAGSAPSTRILTGRDLAGRPERLGAEDLAGIGRMIAAMAH
jgi:glycerate kinase